MPVQCVSSHSPQTTTVGVYVSTWFLCVKMMVFAPWHWPLNREIETISQAFAQRWLINWWIRYLYLEWLSFLSTTLHVLQAVTVIVALLSIFTTVRRIRYLFHELDKLLTSEKKFLRSQPEARYITKKRLGDRIKKKVQLVRVVVRFLKNIMSAGFLRMAWKFWI